MKKKRKATRTPPKITDRTIVAVVGGAHVGVLPPFFQLSDWPVNCGFRSTAAARHFVRSNRDELLKAGAIVRAGTGKQLTVISAAFMTWLTQPAHRARVESYDIAANDLRNRHE